MISKHNPVFTELITYLFQEPTKWSDHYREAIYVESNNSLRFIRYIAMHETYGMLLLECVATINSSEIFHILKQIEAHLETDNFVVMFQTNHGYLNAQPKDNDYSIWTDTALKEI